MATTNWPTVEDIRSFLANSPSAGPMSEEQLTKALDAGTGRVTERCIDFIDDLPDVVVQAIVMQSARLYRRRFSLSGYEGFGEVGIARVTALDADIEDLLVRYLRYDFA